ncbi:hypothetical protein JCM8202_000659 [Rhodotorula sphaerocarpa]
MHCAVPRVPPDAAVELELPPNAAPPALTGLVSALRPIRRNAAQLADEAAMLRRLIYKHKNQHKGQRWWTRITEVDRCTSRAVDELARCLAVFGMQPGSEVVGALTVDSVCKGLLAIPRVLLIVEKNLQVLLNCAGILEQLVESRAFLAFALVVVALAARLHTLFSVLSDDLDRAATALDSLVKQNKLEAVVRPLETRVPTDLRRFLPSERQAVPEPRTGRALGAPLPDGPAPKALHSGQDDLGSVVQRPAARSGSGSARSTPSHSTGPPSRASSLAPTADTSTGRKQIKAKEAAADPSRGLSELGEKVARRREPAAKVATVRPLPESIGPSATGSDRLSTSDALARRSKDLPSARPFPPQAASTSKSGDLPTPDALPAPLPLERSKATSKRPSASPGGSPAPPPPEKKKKKAVKKRSSSQGDEIDAIFG